MTEQAQAERDPAYNMAGTVSGISVHDDKNGKPYARMTYDTTVDGKPARRVTMAFGKAFEKIEPHLKDGPMRLFGKFDGGTIVVIGMGREPKARQAA